MKKTVEEQFKIITKGVERMVNEEDLKKKLEKSLRDDKPLIVKLGLDPSAPDIHLGHAVVLRKMKQMQDLGHQIVIVIGDFTGKIGDPTGKTQGRKALSQKEVEENAETYKQQIFKILDPEKTMVRFNSEWLGELKFDSILKLASTTTVARMLERDDFHNRYTNNFPIGLHEFFYPLMQAYDSIELKADIELGGTDQTFNILMGRTLQKTMSQEEQIALFMPILEGLDGVEKMSKSLGNYIGIYEPAHIMFKKVMEIPDSLIIKYYELATDVHPDDIEVIKKELSTGKNPKDVKFQLAKEITALYHTTHDVEEAIKYYEAAFTKKSIPDIIPDLVLDDNKDLLRDIIPLLVKEKHIQSGSEFRRLLKQGGVQINEEKAEEPDLDMVLACGDVIKIGKKKFVKIVK
ncbi:tyrosine--tRNA ligase [Anaerocolumna aminovalerica]|uniref:Tyrosine--tRNA ligase n=1 Tax=Anaerocolumna aminovalerica TaxID=1527 RepID=A0A1I5HA68_9FIRM|nr:tyrosine--tRNA ligase [Anaerocolumna aminovalerica]MBU5333949.1 tyrosine--tRNA ligase [Anaerocolumna aminovalerica]MDU6265186.1 tyrosine--tRNA ligase [Anaerocolumna aminovalerica]SFO45165.1 tyrosyl-tRNA synthetase [Anaerocolumna aminovalerica]